MKKLRQKIALLGQRLVDLGVGNGLMQEENEAFGEDTVTKEMAELARQCGAEGCVLLENDGTLPLKKDTGVAVFGRCQLDWFYVGYGSGGDVHPPYRVNLMEGLSEAGVLFDKELAGVYKTWCNSEEHKADHGWWGHWPMHHPEMPVSEEMVNDIAKRCDTAVVVIGRAAGEDRENTLTEGSYYLTGEEKELLSKVTGAFAHTVVLLNIGGIMDFSWIKEYGDKLSAVLLTWQGGMESGHAVADVLTGKVNPCGKLSDTVAVSYEDYPSSENFGGLEFNEYKEDIFVGYRYFETYAKEKVLYPFGYGLSYTEFTVEPEQIGPDETGTGYQCTVKVKNTGTCAGKEAVLLWCAAPEGHLPKPVKALAAYGKTGELAPGEEERLTLFFDARCLASYDENGATGFAHAFVLEAGEYVMTCNSMDAGSIVVEETICVQQCENACNTSVDLRERILDRLPKEFPKAESKGNTLSQVAEGKISLEEFIAQLSDQELEALSRGEGGMNSSLGTVGNAGAFGGVIESLRKKGVPAVITSDGPSGLRLRKFTALLPSGTAIACTFNDALVEEMFTHIGKEMKKQGVDVVLSPGMNIHRNPLCGRNFEYFSEDPLLTGKMAAAVVRGVQSEGKSCCPKHFACNNKETKRNTNDSRVSERALREIYLRGFEICVKESHPNTIMTSYNKVNGVWSHYNYDLATTVLRGEWGFDGVVITDWWMQKSKSPEFPGLRDNAYRVRAQVDVLMPGNMGHVSHKYQSDGTLLATLGKKDGITRAELQRTAGNVLKFILKTKF